MDLTFDNISENIKQLKQYGLRLSERVTSAAEALRTAGMCPPIDLVKDLQSYRDQFQYIRSWVQRQPGLGASDLQVSLPSNVAELEKEVQQKITFHQASTVLGRIQSIYHTEGESHPVSNMLQHACTAVREELLRAGPDSNRVALELQNGTHPLTALWSLVAKSDTLDDARWAELLEQVNRTLGREIGTSVARRKLRLRADNKPVLSLVATSSVL